MRLNIVDLFNLRLAPTYVIQVLRETKSERKSASNDQTGIPQIHRIEQLVDISILAPTYMMQILRETEKMDIHV